MEELTKMLQVLNTLCDLLNAKNTDHNYSVVDWVFGFIVFKNDEKATDGNFIKILSYLTNEFEK